MKKKINEYKLVEVDSDFFELLELDQKLQKKHPIYTFKQAKYPSIFRVKVVNGHLFPTHKNAIVELSKVLTVNRKVIRIVRIKFIENSQLQSNLTCKSFLIHSDNHPQYKRIDYYCRLFFSWNFEFKSCNEGIYFGVCVKTKDNFSTFFYNDYRSNAMKGLKL